MNSREIKANAINKYHRDGMTCDIEKFTALYISACIWEMKKRPHIYGEITKR